MTPTKRTAGRTRGRPAAIPLQDRLDDALARLGRIEFGDGFEPAAPAAIVAAGLHLAPVPVAAGGLGIGAREAVELLAAIGAEDGSTALGFAMHVHVVAGMAQADGWSKALDDRVHGLIRDEGALINAASTEDAGGSPARGAVPETTATSMAAGGYRLTGEKSWTTWLPALRLALVSARIVDESPPVAGDRSVAEVGIFLVDLETKGVTRLPGFSALGMRGSASGRLHLDGVRVPADRIVLRRRTDRPDPRGPAPGAWFGLAMAGVYLGVGEGARSEVVRWAVDRRPGDGSTAVADLPTVQLRLGRLDAALRAARIVVLDVAARWDAADPRSWSALLPDIALAKLVATQAAVTATDETLRIAGGPGFLEGRLERAFRDARAGLINPPLEDVAVAGFARTLVERERAGG
ncbi:MAG TPA: acyl-CoA dehydrogenase [Patescibacteria group bacterium]|nr:acyl-CoA dehydrogenase [Patescibacteria group bacterium]